MLTTFNLPHHAKFHAIGQTFAEMMINGSRPASWNAKNSKM